MHSLWEPAIPQAMQQHGGRNRTVVTKPKEDEPVLGPLAHALAPVGDEAHQPERPVSPVD